MSVRIVDGYDVEYEGVRLFIRTDEQGQMIQAERVDGGTIDAKVMRQLGKKKLANALAVQQAFFKRGGG